MTDEKTNQSKNSAQDILLLIAYLLALWVVTALWLWLGGFIALEAGYSTTWLIAGLTLLGWIWLTWMGLKIPNDLFSDVATKAKRLLTAIYLLAALPQLVVLILAFLFVLGAR